MKCYECARAGTDVEAVALCRFCMVGLCLAHRAEVAAVRYPVPTYTCHHWPAAAGGVQQPPEARR